MATRSVKPEKEKLTMVFKAATQIKNRKREDYVTVAELAESLGRKMNEIELEEVLKSLSDQGNIHYIENEKKIYM